jgi:hypothetical protein
VETVRWLSWDSAAFARARAEDRPVLLSIAAPWCESCLDMDRTTYADPRVAQVVNDCFVPIRVNPDRRPDISDRYSLGGWPTTAFLTADGEVIGGGTYVTVDRMPSVLERVAAAFKSRSAEFVAAAGHAEARTCDRPADVDVATDELDLLARTVFHELRLGMTEIERAIQRKKLVQ